jgi:hypothetical protein
VTEGHGAEHHFFAEQLGFGLDHQHRVLGAGDDEFEIGVLEVTDAGVQHVVAVDHTDLGSTDRALERHAGQDQGGGSADQRRNVAVHFGIQRHHGGDDLDLVAELFGEERTDRTIDQARGQRFLFGRTAFALEEAAGDAPGGVELFLIVDGEREEILPFACLAGRYRRDQHDGTAHADHDCAASLAGDFARFQRDFVITVLERLGYFRHCHLLGWCA